MKVLTTAALIAMLVACSSTPEVTLQETGETAAPAESDTPTPSPTPEPSPSPTVADERAAARDYIEALVSGTPSEMDQMAEHAEPGSPAEAYALFQTAAVRAQEADGLDVPAETMTVDGGEIRTCDPEGNCFTFADFVASSDTGKLVTFTVNGNDLEPLIVGAGEPVAVQGAMVERVGAYQSPEYGGTVVALRVQAGDEMMNINVYSAEYVGPDGAQTTVRDVFGPIELRSGASGWIALAFPDTERGGLVYLDGSFGSNYDSPWEVEIPTS